LYHHLFSIFFILQHLKCDEFFHFHFFNSISFTTCVKLLMIYAITNEPIDNCLFSSLTFHWVSLAHQVTCMP
jgi:hypothetical protein